MLFASINVLVAVLVCFYVEKLLELLELFIACLLHVWIMKVQSFIIMLL